MAARLSSCLLFLTLVIAPARAQDAPVTSLDQAGNPVYEMKTNREVKPPKLTYSVDPLYPKEARRNKVEGRCTIELIVDVNGKPEDLTVFRSIAADLPLEEQRYAPDLDQSAMRAIEQFRFKPGTLRGKPVAVKISVVMNFKLDHQGFF